VLSALHRLKLKNAMRIPRTLGLLAALFLCLRATAQEAEAGFTLPLTITGEGLYTHRLQSEDAQASPISGGFHAVLYPGLKLGEHWFVYSSIHLYSTPFYYWDAYETDHQVESHVVQAFLGYTQTYGTTSVMFKAGQLTSAFGSFPVHYDDADNPLLDQPLPYSTYLNLHANQLPCGVNDLVGQEYWGSAGYHCGGSSVADEGLTPATLYGLPGIEADVSTHKVDARFQLTNSSPANPQTLWSHSQRPQWTAGAGYSLVQGFRVGFSAFRGPFLDHSVVTFLPAGHSVSDFPATGVGLDAQWARGRWATSGEWQWFRFDYPNFSHSPTTSFGYGEIKAVLNARTYLAARAGYQRNSRVADSWEQSDEGFAPNVQSYEFAVGVRPNRWQLLKVGYEWLRGEDISGTRDNVFGIQLVTSIHAISKALR
jgi:hypothetical protein